MKTRVSRIRSAGIDGAEPTIDELITASFIRFSAVDNSCAGRVTGASPLARSASMTPVVWSIDRCMKSAQSSRTSGLFALTSAAAAHTAGWAANVAKNALMPARSDASRSAVSTEANEPSRELASTITRSSSVRSTASLEGK